MAESEQGEHKRPAGGGRDRRQYERHHLGLPIRVHFDNGVRSADVEMADVSHGGGRFVGMPLSRRVSVGESIAFGFVLPGPVSCVASARVVRSEPGEFAVQVDRANEAYQAFIAAFNASPSSKI